MPIPYFHVVFTIPPAIAGIAPQNKKTVFQILFRTSARTLLTIAADPNHLGATIGFFTILHAWGRNPLFHPHGHCVVTGGGLSPDGGIWNAGHSRFFLGVRVLSRRFRRLFLEAVQQACAEGRLQFHGALEPRRDADAFQRHLEPAKQTEWVVYAKPPRETPT